MSQSDDRRWPWITVAVLASLAGVAIWQWDAVVALLDGSDDEGELRETNSEGRSGAMLVPEDRRGDELPLAVLLHQSGSSGDRILRDFAGEARRRGFAAVAPSSGRASSGGLGWELADGPGARSDDHEHVLACIEEARERGDFEPDEERVLIAGYGTGGAAAAQIATNEPFFTSFAVLHGDIRPETTGGNAPRGWFSTSESDRSHPPRRVERWARRLRGGGAHPEIVFQLFPGGGARPAAEEIEALLDWWLAY